MTALYELTDDLLTVAAWMDEHDDEIRAAEGAIPDELAELLAASEGAFEQKVERVALFIRDRIGQSEMVAKEARRLVERSDRLRRQADALKRYLLINLERAGVSKVKGELIDTRVQKSPPSVVCSADVKTLPEAYQIQPPLPAPTINRERILALWKEGVSLPVGVDVVQGVHVRFS